MDITRGGRRARQLSRLSCAPAVMKPAFDLLITGRTCDDGGRRPTARFATVRSVSWRDHRLGRRRTRPAARRGGASVFHAHGAGPRR
jgi:hypothetical protein